MITFQPDVRWLYIWWFVWMGNDHLPCSPTTTTVMSSREKLTLCQISVATFTNRYAAVSNYCCWKGIIKVITYSFSRYSQMPSEATTINLSSGLVSNSITSAYPIVPAFIPALSPKERVMARPGIATYFIHTLAWTTQRTDRIDILIDQ